MMFSFFPIHKWVKVGCFAEEPVLPEVLKFRFKDGIIVEMSIAGSARLLFEIKGNRNEVMIGVNKGSN